LLFCLCKALRKTADEMSRDEAKERAAKEVEAAKDLAVAKRKDEKAEAARKRKDKFLSRANAAAKQEEILLLEKQAMEANAALAAAKAKSSAVAPNLVSTKYYLLTVVLIEFFMYFELNLGPAFICCLLINFNFQSYEIKNENDFLKILQKPAQKAKRKRTDDEEDDAEDDSDLEIPPKKDRSNLKRGKTQAQEPQKPKKKKPDAVYRGGRR
jgi:hypothetical protein